MTRLVTMKDTRPLTIKQEDLTDGPVSVCRCGLSADWPFCDGSHVLARKEEPGRLYKYHRDDKDEKAVQEEVATPLEDADPRPWIKFEGARRSG